MSNEQGQAVDPVAAQRAELNRIQQDTIVNTLTEQRDSALNQVVNLTAEKAMLHHSYTDMVNRVKGLAQTVATLQQQLVEQQHQTNSLAELNADLKRQLLAATTPGEPSNPPQQEEQPAVAVALGEAQEDDGTKF